MITVIVAFVAAALWLNVIARVGLVAARMYQIEEYEGVRLVAWARQLPWLMHPSVSVATVLAVAGWVVSFAAGSHDTISVCAGWIAAGVAVHLWWRWLPPKKALVFTPRMQRLLGTAILLAAALVAVVALLAGDRPHELGFLIPMLVALLTALVPVILITANVINRPVEASIRRTFLARARARIAELQPEIVAVVGSYGKTSTKHILAHLLQPSLATLPTPRSFNTLMGVCRTVNDDLRSEHRAFVVEMDPYAPGEVAAICRLTPPHHAIITAVGPQHLERFGSVERIGDALFEVVEALPQQGTLVVHGGEARTAQLGDRAAGAGRPVVRYGIEDESDQLDVVARNVVISGNGSRFRWEWPARKLAADVELPLLGRHQVLNTTAALAMVVVMGQSLDAALTAVTTLQPVEHRLQPVPTANAVTVIDDSYNANPVGVHNALDVIAEMQAGQRILVTPGMVELGDLEESENRRYGEHAAKVCDIVLVADARPGQAVLAGLKAAGMAAEKIHLIHSLADATALIGRLARPGDVVLFANDLPDTYLGSGDGRTAA